MADISQIIGRLDTSIWTSVSNITGTWGCYLVGIKGESVETDTIDVKNLSYVVLEIGIDSGISQSPITITRVKLNFNEETSSDPNLNSKTALAKLTQMPSTIHLRPIAFADQNKEYLSGTINVSVNAIPF